MSFIYYIIYLYIYIVYLYILYINKIVVYNHIRILNFIKKITLWDVTLNFGKRWSTIFKKSTNSILLHAFECCRNELKGILLELYITFDIAVKNSTFINTCVIIVTDILDIDQTSCVYLYIFGFTLRHTQLQLSSSVIL